MVSKSQRYQRLCLLAFFPVLLLASFLFISPTKFFNLTYSRIIPLSPTDDPAKYESHDAVQNSEFHSLEDPRRVSSHTTIPGHASAYGFTMLDNLYLRNGTFYILTSDPSQFPERRFMISRPLELGPGQQLDPTDQELQFLDPENAREVLGPNAMRIDDLSVIVYDPPQFMTHLYHWWGEIVLGFWRVYSTLGANPTQSLSEMPSPKRFFLPFSTNGGWRDRVGVDGPLMRVAFPHTSIEEAGYWDDLKKLQGTVVFDRVMLINRPAAHRHPFSSAWFKMIASTMAVTPPAHFFEPIRARIVRNILGRVPSPANAEPDKPLVLYVSRQGAGNRRLLEADHEQLVGALRALEAEGICEFQVPQMEKLSIGEQIKLAARSTVILGVHGNGLSHQLWMPPSNLSTVIEIFYPRGYIFDYELLARNMGHKHIGVWNDTFLTYPAGIYHEGIFYGENFHGRSIPVSGPAVAALIRERLTGSATNENAEEND